MKIVFFDYVFERNAPGITGLSDVVWEMAQGLAAIGEDVHIVAPYADDTTGPEGVTIHSFALPPINYRDVFGHILIVVKAWKVIERRLSDADIIHAPEYLSTAVFSMLGLSSVVLTTPGNIYAHIHNNANYVDPITTIFFKIAARTSARKCARIIAISNDMKYWWEFSGASASRIAVIPYGVDIKRFHPVANAQRRVGWSSRCTHLLYVGRLSHEKGADLLLKAFAQVAKDNPCAQLHVVGEGPDRALLQSLVQKLGLAGQVTFHGWVKKHQLPQIYAASDVCVVPSRTEAFGRIVLESMACRTAVVGARVGGIPDMVKDNITGLLFDVGNTHALAERLRWAMQNGSKMEEMARIACEYVHHHQTWQVVAERILHEVYQPIIEREYGDH